MRLSVCLVTRNEEAKLPRVIGSVAGQADEVVVADTGSTDRTVAEAAELGARVYAFAWDDDFSAARNFAIEQASGDWILWLNPDEELLPDNRELIPDLLARDDVLAYFVRIEEWHQPPAGGKPMESVQPRLFRKHPELRFEGRLHPHFTAPLAEFAARHGLQVSPANLVIRHHAYLSTLTDDKLRWAVRLLDRELRDRPGDLHYLIELGRTLLRLLDARGHDVLAQAAEQVAALRQEATAPTATVGLLLEYLMTVSPEFSKCTLTKEDAIDLVRRWFPRTPPLLWVLAEQAFRANDYRRAAEALETLVRLGRDGSYDRAAPFNPSLMGEPALLNLGKCQVRLGDLEAAESCFRQLLHSTTPQGQQARQNFAYVQSLKRKAKPPPTR